MIFKHILNIWVPRRVYYKRQELLIFCEHFDSPPGFLGFRVSHLFSFCVAFCFCVLFVFVLCRVCSNVARKTHNNRGWTQVLQRVSICIWENDKMWSVYRRIKKQTTTIHIALMAGDLYPTYLFSLPPQQESYQKPVKLAPQESTQMLCILPTTF